MSYSKITIVLAAIHLSRCCSYFDLATLIPIEFIDSIGPLRNNFSNLDIFTVDDI